MTDSGIQNTTVTPNAPALADPITASVIQHGDWIRALTTDPWLVVIDEPQRVDREINGENGPQLVNITSFNVQVEGKGATYPWSGYSSLTLHRKHLS